MLASDPSCPQSSPHTTAISSIPLHRISHPAGEHGGFRSSLSAFPSLRPILQFRNQLDTPPAMSAMPTVSTDYLLHTMLPAWNANHGAVSPARENHAIPRNPSRALISYALMPTCFHNADHTGGENCAAARSHAHFERARRQGMGFTDRQVKNERNGTAGRT